MNVRKLKSYRKEHIYTMKSYTTYVYHYNFLNYEIKNYKDGHNFNMGAKRRKDIYYCIIHGQN